MPFIAGPRAAVNPLPESAPQRGDSFRRAVHPVAPLGITLPVSSQDGLPGLTRFKEQTVALFPRRVLYLREDPAVDACLEGYLPEPIEICEICPM